MERTMSNKHEKNDSDVTTGSNRSVVDRRSGLDRRNVEGGEASSTNLERRRGVGRRLTDFVRSAEEGEMSREQQMFLHAIDAFKRVNGVAFPTWTDVLEVVRRLGYRKTSASELNLGPKAEDWTESADAPSRLGHGEEIDAPQRYRKAG